MFRSGCTRRQSRHGVGGQGSCVLVEGVHLRSDGFKRWTLGGGTGFQRSELMLKALARPNADWRLQLNSATPRKR